MFAVAALTGLAGCNDGVDLQLHENAHASVRTLDGWTATEVRNDVRFSSTAAPDQTIVIRAVDRTAQPGRQDDARLLAATARVNHALPRFQSERAWKISTSSPHLTGTAESFQFVPPGKREAYRRVHVTLFGENFVYHVLQTAPASAKLDEAALNAIVATLKEEAS